MKIQRLVKEDSEEQPMNVAFNEYQQLADDYQRIEQAIMYLEEHFKDQPALKDVASSVGLSEYHFQRLFTRWAGISPKRFLQFLTKEHAKDMLERSDSLLEVTYKTGLSGPGRLHDLFVNCEAVTPGEYKQRGEGLSIAYGFHPTPFGECLLALTDRGVCGLQFPRPGVKAKVLRDLKRRWSRAELVEDPYRTSAQVKAMFSQTNSNGTTPLGLYLHGTNFQIKVWEALLRIPPGNIVTYEDVAVFIGKPTAARAVSRAVADNPIAYLIPCHRVIRKTGAFGGYRWGTARKKAILGYEMASGVA